MTEAERIRKVQNGDLASFGPLVESYQGLVFTYLRRLGHDYDTALDLLQETFTKALSSISDLRETAAFKSWLMRIARNESIRLRRKSKESSFDFSEAEGEALLAKAQEVLETQDPSALATQTFEAQALVEGLSKIPEKYREILLLRFQGGLAYKEIARVLDISLENTKFRIHHGLKLLRARVLT